MLKIPAVAVAALLMTVDAAAMSPISSAPGVMSAQIFTPASALGAENLEDGGIGVTLSNRYERRRQLLSGGRTVDNVFGESSTQWRTTLSVDAQVTDRLALTVSQPYARTASAFATVDQSSEGFGDLSVLSRWSLARSGSGLRRREAFGLAGVEFPTGRVRARDAGGVLLAPTQQPGSGSTNGIVGASGVLGTGDVLFFGSVVYTLYGPASYSFGNSLSASLGSLCPLPRVPKLALTAGAEFRRAEPDHGQPGGPGVGPDGTVASTGSETLSLAPGLRFTQGAYTIAADAAIPVYRQVSGSQLGAGTVFETSLSARFGSGPLFGR